MLVRGLATLPAACSCGRRRNPWKVEKVVGRWSNPKISRRFEVIEIRLILIIEVISTESWDLVSMGTAWTILHWLPAICKIPEWWPGNGAKWSLIRLIPTSQIIVVPSKLLSFLQLDVRTTTQIQVFQWRSLNGVVFLTSIDFQIHFKSLFCTSFPRHFPCAPSNPPLRTQPSAGCGEA